jgi:hypothetical protein
MTQLEQSSRRWWQSVKQEPEKLVAWLFDQYRGEATAAGRIEAVRDRFAVPDSEAWQILSAIADQERDHAQWVGELLQTRGYTPVVRQKTERYWPNVMREIADLETACAVGAHAEGMRLARIRTIAADTEPQDVVAVFQRILPQEEFHERAFRRLASPGALEATRARHELGTRALGLVS